MSLDGLFYHKNMYAISYKCRNPGWTVLFKGVAEVIISKRWLRFNVRIYGSEPIHQQLSAQQN